MTNEEAIQRAAQDGLYSCRKSGCYIPDLLERGYVALFPLEQRPESRILGYFLWSFYVHFTDAGSGRVNNRNICESHHKVLLAMWTKETAQDVREQEFTDNFMIQNGGRL